MPTHDTRSLSDLTSHPRQAEIYGDISLDELSALTEDIDRVGIRQPVEITEDGVIIDGHQRCRAAARLGWETVPVLVHAELSEDEVFARFVKANLVRRQLDPLSRARAIQALHITERKFGNSQGKGRIRDRVAEAMGPGVSGPTVDRYLRLLKLARPIQDAVSSETLPMMKALRILRLPESTQHNIAERIRAGESPRTAVDAALAPSPEETEPDPVAKGCEEYAEMLRPLARTIAGLPSPEDLAAGAQVPHSGIRTDILRYVRNWADEMIDAEQAAVEAGRERFQRLLAAHPKVAIATPDPPAEEDDDDDDDRPTPTVAELDERIRNRHPAAAEAMAEIGRWIDAEQS